MVGSSPIADHIERRLRRIFGHGVSHDTHKARCAQPANQRGPPIDTFDTRCLSSKRESFKLHVQSTNAAQACKVIARWEYFSGRGMVSLHHVTALCVKSENEDVAAEW